MNNFESISKLSYRRLRYAIKSPSFGYYGFVSFNPRLKLY